MIYSSHGSPVGTCPYLGTERNAEVYYAKPAADSRCYANVPDDPSTIPLDFQAGTCLTDGFPDCSRFRAAERRSSRQGLGTGRLLLAGVVTVVVLGICGFALVAGLAGWLGTRQATDTPTATITPSPTPTETLTPLPTDTPTPVPTDTASPSPEPSDTDIPIEEPTPTPLETATAVASPTPPPTIPPPPTVTRPRPTATPPRPTATRTPSRTPTGTSSPTATRTITPTPTPLGCRNDEVMSFSPATPLVGQAVTIEVRSTRGHTDVSLTGPDEPDWIGVSSSGGYYYWRWSITYDSAGGRTYSFKIHAGMLTCVTATVTVSEATSTPTATATYTATPTNTVAAPSYGVALSGDDFETVLPGDVAELLANLQNTGTMQDTFDVGLDAAPPGGWQAKYCIGAACYDYTWPSESVTIPAGGNQALSVKLIAPVDAPEGQQVSATLWVASQSDPAASASLVVTAEVVAP